MTQPGSYAAGDLVRSSAYGVGKVELDKGLTVLARFDHGYEEVAKSDLEQVVSPLQGLERETWDSPLEVVTRVQAEAIRSVNDTWGVFSRSRISLLPHQLWVCRKVLEDWPTRWVVADDVGLGKTIEAGLILWPLLSRKRVRRLLILTPASLVEQWQHRMRTMFDIRLLAYTPDADTEKSDFWGNDQVVASLETLRQDRKGRHERMLAAQPWDLLLVDEAHRLNADEEAGPTLGYRFVEKLDQAGLLRSIVFFTGTPHRGKNFGFFSLLKLLRPERFDPKGSLEEQLPLLRGVMIRNNKQNVTDLRGKRLFQPLLTQSRTYSYSPTEASFYDTLTEFIVTGKAYASSLSRKQGQAVMLVLIAMQKLASSSVAALSRALRGRLTRIAAARRELAESKEQQAELRRRLVASEEEEDFDAQSAIEEQLAEAATVLQLMEDEEARLQELVDLARDVEEETKILEIMRLLESGLSGRSVLFFTEYKATQSLLLSALTQRYGDGCAVFINGDELAHEVANANGESRSISLSREEAAAAFNSGRARFLVSTEAGGEGIDLQESCHTLVHVDLPWNPMRLHQRVGRLNRYGQKHRVEVYLLRNPDTVESRIWDHLNAKIERINRSLREVMEDPEDLYGVVLGMTPPSVFTDVFSGADQAPPGGLSAWFDQKTSQFGGQDAISTVKALVGNCTKFDFQAVSDKIPRVDLPALRPFFLASLHLNRRKPTETASGLSFKTPEAWRSDPAVRRSYEGLFFERQSRGADGTTRMLGVGHRLFDLALERARDSTAAVATTKAPEAIKHPLAIYRIRDRVTSKDAQIRTIVVGVEFTGETPRVLRDWEVLLLLNDYPPARGTRSEGSAPHARPEEVRGWIAAGETCVKEAVPSLDLPFRFAALELLAFLCPASFSN